MSSRFYAFVTLTYETVCWSMDACIHLSFVEPQVSWVTHENKQIEYPSKYYCSQSPQTPQSCTEQFDEGKPMGENLHYEFFS